MTDFSSFDRLIDERMPAWTEDLMEYCRIPSETGNADALRAAARWTSERLMRLGASTETIALDGVPPLVLGEIGSGQRRLICVQHYDVVPAAPLDLWVAPPFEPDVRDGHLFARGSSDNKGMLLMRMHAVEAWREVFGELPCRVRFLVEGEEESGSNNLKQLLARRPQFLQADAALNEAGYIDPQGRPLVTCGLRGILYVELSVRTLAGDTHSEMAMLLPNAGERLLRALSTLKMADGRIAVAGFYDDVVEPASEQLDHLHALPFEEAALKRIHGVSAFVGGKTGPDAQTSTMFEPTCNISGVWSGWNGPGMKTVIPAEARAKVDMRLIPDQHPDRILACLRRHLDGHGFGDVAIAVLADESPWWTSVAHPLARAAAGACEDVFGRGALRIISSMSTAPMFQVCAEHRLPAVGIGCVHVDSRAHAPNENISLDLMAKGTKVFGRFLASFAGMQ